MTRRDYVLLTNTLKDGMADYRTEVATKGILSTHVALHKMGYLHAAKLIGKALNADNPHFDIDRFHAELGITDV